MRYDTYENIKKLHDKYGSKQFGKICQKMLAIAFKTGGFEHVVEREVQGVDIDAAGEGRGRYTIEVKTSAGKAVPLEQKDVECLKDRQRDGYQRVLAALQISRFGDWIFARADTLEAGDHEFSKLRAYRIRDLEALIGPLFEQVVEEHAQGALKGAQSYLNRVLGEKGVVAEK